MTDYIDIECGLLMALDALKASSSLEEARERIQSDLSKFMAANK